MLAAVGLAILLILALGVVLANRNFSARIDREIAGLLSAASAAPRVVVTEEMLSKLPPPVQKYLAHSGVLGKAIPRTVRLRQRGRIRQSAKSAWMKLEAVEYYATTPPAFLWKAWLPSSRLPLTVGRDCYSEGRGGMLIKLLSFIPLVDAAGAEMDQGSLMRYLNEMTWFPAAFLGPNIAWKAIDDRSAEVTLTDRGRSVSAVMEFGEDGRPLNFVTQRYRMAGKRFDLETWATPFTGFGEFEGLNLPIRGKAAWKLEEGELEYVELELTELEYDRAIGAGS